MYMHKDIIKSKNTGKRFVVTRIQAHCKANYINVVPEDSYEEYIANISFDYGFYEGYSPWAMPLRDLEGTGEVYKAASGATKVIDYWK